MISVLVIGLLLLSVFNQAQTVTNGSLNGTPVGNSQIAAGSAGGWTVCGFSPDLCNTTFPSYTPNSQVPSSPSPDGGNWLGIAALGECAQTTITGLTAGNTYTLYFCGACFGTAAAGTGIYNMGPAMPQICVGATCQTYSFPMGPNWNSLSLTFTATAATMTLQARAPTGNYYACLDGFNLVGPCSTPQIPIANFSVNDTDICTGTCLSFTDLSTNNPTTWAWTFSGANTTTSTAQNPANICYSSAGTYTATLTASNSFGSSNFSRTIKVYAPAASTINVNICTGDSMLINGIYRSTTGAYADTLLTIHGCDSVVTTNLTVLPNASSTQILSICTGDSLLINDNYESAAGTYIANYTSANGCDSVSAITLNVLPTLTSTQNVSICAGDSILINGSYESTSGIYTAIYTAVNGCDSVVATTLSILPVSTSSQSISICNGDSVLINGSYESTGGTYIAVYTSVNGCDSTVTVNLSILSVISVSQNLFICAGDSILINGNYESNPGTYSDTLTSLNGCDSIINNSLTVLPTSASTQTVFICSGDSLIINGNYETTGGTYSNNFLSVNGCDSVATTVLVELPVSASSQNVSICNGDSILINGVYQNISGTYISTFISSNGCDSLVTVNLNVLPTLSNTQTISICAGDSILINGSYESNAGTYSANFTSMNGCDSTSAITLSVISIPSIYLGNDTTLCIGETLSLNVATPNANYLWQDNSTNAAYTVTQQGTFWVEVAVSNCSSEDTIEVNYDSTGCNCFLFAPNVFTPNNDGNNDRFNAFASCGILDIHLVIFNRWGEKVFDTYNELGGWDGLYQGQPAPAGVYVYLITYRLAKSNFANIHGTVTLIR